MRRALTGVLAWSCGCAQLLGLDEPVAGAIDGGTDIVDAAPSFDAGVACLSAPSFDRTSYPTSSPPHKLAAGDLNQDGRDDLVATLFDGLDAVAIFFNDQTDTFPAPVGLGSFCARGDLVTIGDINADGRADLVFLVGCPNARAQLLIQRATPPGSFDPPVVFTSTQLTQYQPANPLLLADLSPASGPDLLAVTNSVQGLELWKHSETMLGELSTPEPLALDQPATSIGVGDFDGDALLDIVYARASSDAVQWMPQSAANPGNFLAPRPLLAGVATAGAVAVGQLGGDARPDVAFTDAQGARIAVQTGQGEFAPGAAVMGHGDVEILLVADLNGDGLDDLVGSRLISLQCTGSPGVFATPASTPPWSNDDPAGLAVGDFDDDGKVDVAVIEGEPGQGTLAVYLQE